MLGDIFSWTNPDTEVREIDRYGKGVFAKEDIKKGSLLAVFGGYVMDISYEELLPDSIKDNALQISENLVLGVKEESEVEVACYFNHSCDPNAGFKGQIFLVAMRDIEKDDQVTFDYGMVLFRSRYGNDYMFKCACGSAQCRGNITNNDWKMSTLREKYHGYFQYFLEEMIKMEK